MLDGPFKESHLRFNIIDPPVLELPEDDPEGVVGLCNIIHYEWVIGKRDFLRSAPAIAHVADKYRCATQQKSRVSGHQGKHHTARYL
jgi:hypothetical protein